MEIIDLDNSFVDFIGENSWRANVKSVLECKSSKRKLYLVKECRAELVGKNPFKCTSIYEFLGIVDNLSNTYYVRTAANIRYGNETEKNTEKDIKTSINIKYKKVEELNLVKVLNILNENKNVNIFSKITFKINNEEYSILSKCEYINYSIKDVNCKYCQPNIGYVPLLFEDRIYIGYAVKYLGDSYEGNLEFRLRTEENIYHYFDNNIVKNLIKKTINLVLKSVKIKDFVKYVSIEDSKIYFYADLN